jgi:hypothetical protein
MKTNKDAGSRSEDGINFERRRKGYQSIIKAWNYRHIGNGRNIAPFRTLEWHKEMGKKGF